MRYDKLRMCTKRASDTFLRANIYTCCMSKEQEAVVSSEKHEVPSWITLKQADIEKLVLQLHDEGNAPAKIGLILRDKHGIPKAKIFGKRITRILTQAARLLASAHLPVQEKIRNLEGHIARAPHDQSARRSLMKKRWLASKAVR